MITLITGTPGAGKTLYAISNLLRQLVGTSVKGMDDTGNEISVPRVIYTNISGLLLDHELIDGREDGGLANWHEWAKPGAVICFDEVQREWKPRPNGSKVPKCIEMLETHRHMGVDFIILTQHPGLLDQNVRALVGRHIHVRRLGGAGFAITYEWDHCSRTLLYSNALKKSPFKYSKEVFKLYKSAELHTKPKTSIPPLLFVALFAIAAFLYLGPTVYQRIAGKAAPAVQSDPAKPAGSTDMPSPGDVRPMAGNGIKPPEGYDWAAFVPRVSHEPWSAPAFDHLRQVVSMPRIVASMCVNGWCKCLTQQRTVALEGQQCLDWIEHRPFDPYKPDPDQPQTLAMAHTDSSPAERKSAIPVDIPDILK
ncbi:MAG: hypothetical protein C0445_00320 [Polaromonas sp.]|nr:hypothetical protein [Polaromonas sp.]